MPQVSPTHREEKPRLLEDIIREKLESFRVAWLAKPGDQTVKISSEIIASSQVSLENKKIVLDEIVKLRNSAILDKHFQSILTDIIMQIRGII